MIDTKLLRQKILDLAIRGKLVPQDPADEPASELLKKIKAEKDALVKAGKIKKDKHESYIFKGDDNRYYETIDGKTTDITDEIPFELANGWSWCRLNNVASLADGDWIESKDQAPTGFRLIQTGNIGKCVFLPHDERARYISQETFLNLNCTEIFPGDCLISRLPDPLGRACIIPDSQERMITAVDCTITRPYKSGLSSLYFMYFTGTTIYNEYVEKNATGSTRKRISRSSLDKVLFPLPPLAEQQRIVKQIETLLKYVDVIDADAETLDKSITLAKQKILDLAIRGKLVPQNPADEPSSELLKKIKAEKEALVKAGKLKKDKHESYIFKGDDNCYHENIDGKVTDITEEIPFDLPESWCWCRLANLASYKKGPFGSSITKAMFVPKGCNTYKVYEQKNAIQKNANIGDYFISKQKFNELKNFEVHPGDIIVSCAGTIGETFVLPPKIYPGIINQALMKIKLFASEIKDFYLLYFDYILKSEANEKGKGSAMKNIPPFDVLKKMLLPLPPLEEQKRIVSQIEKLFAVLETMRG